MRTDQLEKLSRIVVSPDGVHASLHLRPGLEPTDITPEAIEAILAARGIRPSKITRSAADLIADQILKDPNAVVENIVAEGVAPVHGIDGRFELCDELLERSRKLAEKSEEGDSNHYARSAFIIVEEGEHLGRVHKHSDAQDGQDVRGKILKANPGRPCQMKFDASVEVHPDGSVVSRRKGRLEFNPSSLSVDPVLEVAESVDFSTGNVSFPGDVIIRKGVKDCFTVDVGGNLEIVELVEAATIKARRTILLRRGMAGRGKGELVAGGDLEARYLDGSDIVVGHDLRVQKELTSCSTRVGRAIESPGCTVNGGELHARFGGRVRALGGEAETETIVAVGRDPNFDELVRTLDEMIPAILKRLEKARAELADLQRSAAKLTPAQAESMTSLQFEIMTGQSRLPKIIAVVEHLLKAYERLDDVTLTVERTIMPGVTISIGANAATIKEPIRGPVTIALDDSGALIMKNPATGTITPLSTKAKLKPAAGALDLNELRRWLESPALRPTTKAA